jgi:hypothetical protein
VSLAAFQSLLTRLVTDADLRRDLVADGEAAIARLDLTPTERRRAIRLAADRGVTVTAALVESFRLGKILALLPLTRRLLGDDRLGEEARRYWLENPPRSFYALDEVIGFCDYLQRRLDQDLAVECLSDVVSLEGTMLDLRRPSPRRGAVTREIRMQHDVVELLGPLSAGCVPEKVRVNPCVLLATAEDDGSVTWAPA